MDTSNSAARVAAVVGRRKEAAGITELGLSDRTNIPRTTLRRRLIFGTFTVAELDLIARALGTTASEILAEALGAVA